MTGVWDGQLRLSFFLFSPFLLVLPLSLFPFLSPPVYLSTDLRTSLDGGAQGRLLHLLQSLAYPQGAGCPDS